MEDFLYCLKFRPINNYLIDSIVNGLIYFPRPSELNDPFDCQLNIENILQLAIKQRSTISHKEFLNSFVQNKDFISNWSSFVDSVGVFSSSINSYDAKESSLLWSPNITVYFGHLLMKYH